MRTLEILCTAENKEEIMHEFFRDDELLIAQMAEIKM